MSLMRVLYLNEKFSESCPRCDSKKIYYTGDEFLCLACSFGAVSIFRSDVNEHIMMQ